MERQRKERLVGAAVLVMLAVIFIPMVLDDSVQPESGITGTNIPAKPEGEFESRVIPLRPAAAPESPGNGAAPQSASPAPPPAAVPPAPESAAVDTRTDGKSVDAASSASPPAPPASGPATPGKAASPRGKSGSPPVGVTAWVVQLGSFSSEQNAENLNRKLRQAGYSAFVEPLAQDGTKVYRVRVGPELRRSGAQAVRDKLLSDMKLDGIVVPYP
jgi:DedD protein